MGVESSCRNDWSIDFLEHIRKPGRTTGDGPSDRRCTRVLAYVGQLLICSWIRFSSRSTLQERDNKEEWISLLVGNT